MSTDNPWSALPEQPPYVLPMDERAVAAHNGKLGHDQQRYRLVTETVLPEPFVGDPRTASVVLLLANVGYKAADDVAHAEKAFQRALRRNLLHGETEFPFYFLGPGFETTPGGIWWRRRLRLLIEDTSVETVARRVACVEWLTYKSTKFKRCEEALPSQSYGWSLVRDALARGAVVVSLRSCKLWELSVPELEEHPMITTASKQSVYITPNNLCLNHVKNPAAYDMVIEALEREPTRAAEQRRSSR